MDDRFWTEPFFSFQKAFGVSNAQWVLGTFDRLYSSERRAEAIASVQATLELIPTGLSKDEVFEYVHPVVNGFMRALPRRQRTRG